MAEDVHIECRNTEGGGLVCEVETRDEIAMLRYRHIFPQGISEADAKNQICRGLKTRGKAILHPGYGHPGWPKKRNAKKA